MERARRRLTVLVALDVAGYSSLIRGHEVRTLSELGVIYRRLGLETLPKFAGTVIKTMGDGALVEFESVLDAVEWTMGFQSAMARRNAARRRAPIWVRAAIVLADVIVADTDRFGAAIGFATRMQEVSPPGGIAITHSVRWQLIGEPATAFKPAGLFTLRSVPYPVEAWMWAPPGVALPEMRPTSAQLLAPDLEGDTHLGDPRPLLVILPFDNLTGDPALEPIADGAVEEITATLARLRDIRVVARNTAYTYKGRATDVRALVRQIGVRYVVEGSLRGSRDRLRITAQFIEAEGGAHLWSGRIDGTAADALTLQDDIATRIAGALHPIIRSAEIARAQAQAGGERLTRSLTLRAMPYFWAHRREDNARALELLTQALAVDARHGLALGLKGWCLAQHVAYMWSDNPARDKALAIGFAERAAQTTEPDALVFTTIGATLSLLQVDQSRPLQFIERALTLDPTFAWAWTRQGYALAYSGKPREGIRALEHAVALSPDDPVLFNAFGGLGTCHFILEDYAAAIHWAQKALNDRPGMVWANRLLATSAAHAGDLDLARSAAQQLFAAHPDLSIRRMIDSIHNLDGPYLDRFLDGLRLAGIPEESRSAEGGGDEELPLDATAPWLAGD
ncbi:tetratricopeptide repeat protein [Labrys wisconsinensis]|uniref:Adenylate cyclase n=1 Tax=Labrys wisconsinensis TaxID=425677 RepID=A0ABU0JL31_9HYPH|nr:tetratricopeptide repeat protein [Labrys wisconsinensis]MDQ0474994.1 adenylate cyclase [Labrys wisconsinensis]